MDMKKTSPHHQEATGHAKNLRIPGNTINYGTAGVDQAARGTMHPFHGKVAAKSNVSGVAAKMHPYRGKKGC